jgi:hypothetical protein
LLRKPPRASRGADIAAGIAVRFHHPPARGRACGARAIAPCLVASLLCATLTARAAPVAAPPLPPTLAQALAAARTALRIEDGRLAGPGAPLLAQAIGAAQFVLIGESHMTREVPRFASAVCDLMAPAGLAALVVESGPQVAAFTQAALGQPDRLERVAALARRYPDSAAFLDMREENDLADHCASVAQDPAFHLWGLDQEFLGSAGWLLDRIQATGPGPRAAAAVARLQARERELAAHARASGDPAGLFLLSVTEDELADADAALQAQGNATANAIFRELRQSARIYRTHRDAAPASNALRARLLKQNLLQDIDSAGGEGWNGRMLVKFGGWHLYKGFNPLHQRDLGNFVAEWADAHGKTALHIAVYALGGEHLVYGGYGRPWQRQAIGAGDVPAWMRPLVDGQVTEGWTLYDLRTLRFVPFAGLDPELERLIYGYDLLVTIPVATPADPLR